MRALDLQISTRNSLTKDRGLAAANGMAVRQGVLSMMRSAQCECSVTATL